jgi:hypothetical protein
LGLSIFHVLEFLLGGPSHKKNNLITTFIIGGLVMILLFSLLTLALPAFEEPFEKDNISSVEIGGLGELNQVLFTASIPLGLELGVLIPIERIGIFGGADREKESDDSETQFTSTVFSILLYTAALFDRAAFLLCGLLFLSTRQVM